MPFDMSRCPQTEDEARGWYFAGIGRTQGAPANDWAAVMAASGLPPGYGPGIVPNASMPFFAFTNMVGSSNEQRGRIFLPTAVPDPNGYYTRQIQVIADGATPGTFVWSWTYISGHAYAPVQGADGGGGNGGTGGGDTSALEARVAELESKSETQAGEIAALTERLTVIEDVLSGPFHAHGPVDLPIVLRNWTSLRALGDIDVEVRPGQAVPPPPGEEIDNAGLKLALLLRRLRDRNDAPDEP